MNSKPKITELLDKNQINYRVIKFSQPVYTVEQSAKESGLDFSQIIKSMLLVDEKGNYAMICLPGTKKVDATKVKKIIGLSKRPHFASGQQVQKKLNLKIGAVTALYAVNKVPIIFDNSIKNLKECSLSAGEHEYEIVIKTQDLINLVKPIFADVVQ